MSSSLAAVLDELRDQLPDPGNHPCRVTDGDQQAVLAVLSAVPDPRRRRGVRHRCTPLLAAAVGAMGAGARSFAAIAEGG